MKSTTKKPAKRKLNVKLLRKIQKHILEEPKRLVMRTLCLTRADEGKETFIGDGQLPQLFAPCGTAACIAGWALLMADKNPGYDSGACEAAELLGTEVFNAFSPDHTTNSGRLFWDDNWPDPFRKQYRDAETATDRAQIAAARIEHLIKTGE